MSKIEYLRAKTLLFLVFLTSVVNIQSQPAPCIDDAHCSVGFFCHTVTNTCHKCLSCELMKRRPASKIIGCIRSDKECGPCFEGLINDASHWGGICLSPESTHVKMLSSYVYLLATCIAFGLLLSIFIAHSIFSTHIIKVKIDIPSHKRKLHSQDTDKTPVGFTA